MEKYAGERFWIKLIIRIIMIVGMIWFFFAIGDLIVDVLILLEITWLRVSTVSSFAISIGIMVSAVIVDRMIDRLFRIYIQKQPKPPKENEPDPEPTPYQPKKKKP